MWFFQGRGAEQGVGCPLSFFPEDTAHTKVSASSVSYSHLLSRIDGKDKDPLMKTHDGDL